MQLPAVDPSLGSGDVISMGSTRGVPRNPSAAAMEGKGGQGMAAERSPGWRMNVQAGMG